MFQQVAIRRWAGTRGEEWPGPCVRVGVDHESNVKREAKEEKNQPKGSGPVWCSPGALHSTGAFHFVFSAVV